MEKGTVKVKWYGYVALLFIILFFSGVFENSEGMLSALDFNNIMGRFGSLGSLEEGAGTLAGNFTGTGGTGARQGFMFGLTLIPGVMLALGVVNVVEHFGGLAAAAKLLSPVLKPIMGIPGITGISLIANLQSSDAAASMTKQLKDDNQITDQERMISVAFQMSAGAMLTNFFGSGVGLFPALEEAGVPILVPIAAMFVFKILGANLMRLYVKFAMKEKYENQAEEQIQASEAK